MLAVYVSDTTPNDQKPTPKVFALLKRPGDQNWNPTKAIVLTDGTHMVQDPTVTFSGNYMRAIAAWTVTMMSESEDNQAGHDMSKVLQRQEIRYAYTASFTYDQWRRFEFRRCSSLPREDVHQRRKQFLAGIGGVKDVETAKALITYTAPGEPLSI